jgi:hypothetical protein
MPNLKGQLALVNSTDWPNQTLQKVKYDLFAPRVGFAYRLTSSTVLRGGYGITHLPMDINTDPSASPVLSAVTSYVAAGSSGASAYIPLNSLSNPFPAGGVPGTIQQSILQPSGRDYNLASLEGLNISGALTDEPFSYAQQWNFNLQHQLKGDLLFEVGYVGSKGLHLPAGTLNLNQLDNSYYSQGTALTASVPNPMAGKLNPTSGYNGATIRAGQLLRPYPQFNNVQSLYSRIGTSDYHSMQARVEKRFGSAGLINANYTWAKIIGDVDSRLNTLDFLYGTYQDFNNIQREKSLSSFDVPHRFVASYVLELPFGKGKKFASGTSGVMGKLISGWAANGIVTLQSGYPIPMKAGNNNLNNLFGAGTIRPSYVPGCVKEFGGRAQDRLSQWWNTACFSQPGAFSFGTEGVVDPQLRMHGINNFDFTMSKNTAISERFTLQFKAEFFNIFNRVQFWVQNTTFGNSNFGTVTAQFNKPRLAQFALRLVF